MKLIADVRVPLHNTWFTGCETSAEGLTVIVNVLAGPGQPLAIAVTVTVAVISVFVLLIAVNGMISPEPVAANPIAVLSLIQLNEEPFTGPVNPIAAVKAPLHTT